MVTFETKIDIPEDILFRDVGGEAVILNMGTGKYYGLDEVGTRMWTLLAEHRQLEPAYYALLDEYEVDEERLKQDLLHLVDKLVSQGLLRVDEA